MLLLFLGVVRFSYFIFKVLVLDGKSGVLVAKWMPKTGNVLTKHNFQS